MPSPLTTPIGGWSVLNNTSLPDVPKPATLDSAVPDLSERLLVASARVLDPRVRQANDAGEVTSRSPWLRVAELNRTGIVNPPFPPQLLVHYRYWQRVDTARIRTGPRRFTHHAKTIVGISETQSAEMSARTGLGMEALSASIWSTVSTSLTVSKAVEKEVTYEVEVPAGKSSVHTIWQLVDELRFEDESGNDFAYIGRHGAFSENALAFLTRIESAIPVSLNLALPVVRALPRRLGGTEVKTLVSGADPLPMPNEREFASDRADFND